MLDIYKKPIEDVITSLGNSIFDNMEMIFRTGIWNGMIYNAFFEWVKTGMSEPVELAIERVKETLKLVANSIETDMTNDTQNKRR